jgi:hypothetical protein
MMRRTRSQQASQLWRWGAMVVAYLYQGHWKQAGYWFAALQLNYWLMRMT